MTAPRIPRQSVSNLQLAITVLAGLAAVGAVAWLYFFWRWFLRLVGWAFA
jgi:hypothetical protein